MEELPAYEGDEIDLDVTDDDRFLDTLIPDSPNVPYDMHQVIERVLDDGDFLEAQPLFAPNIVIGFGRIEGRSASWRTTRCSTPSYTGHPRVGEGRAVRAHLRRLQRADPDVRRRPGTPAGHRPGVGRHHPPRRQAHLRVREAKVPLVTVITRKAYGGAYDVMGSKHLGADINLAWPTAQIAVMGAQGAVNILYRKELAQAAEAGDWSRRRARASSRSTRTRWPTPTSRPSAATSTR